MILHGIVFSVSKCVTLLFVVIVFEIYCVRQLVNMFNFETLFKYIRTENATQQSLQSPKSMYDVYGN